MARVICDIENFNGKVNDVEFTRDRGQWLSEEITDEQAAYLASVPGYRLVAAQKSKAMASSDKPDAAKPEK